MPTVIDLIKDTKISHIKNKNSPPGCRVSLTRDKSNGRVIKLTTKFANGRIVEELADHKSPILNNDSSLWEAFDEEGYVKDYSEKSLKESKERLSKLKEQEINKSKIMSPIVKGNKASPDAVTQQETVEVKSDEPSVVKVIPSVEVKSEPIVIPPKSK